MEKAENLIGDPRMQDGQSRQLVDPESVPIHFLVLLGV